jgi:hypothetical protein
MSKMADKLHKCFIEIHINDILISYDCTKITKQKTEMNLTIYVMHYNSHRKKMKIIKTRLDLKIHKLTRGVKYRIHR